MKTIPLGWSSCLFNDLIDKIIDNRGKTPVIEKNQTDYPLLEVNSISENMSYPDYNKVTKYVSQKTYNEWFRAGHPIIGDILMPTVGTLGNAVIMTQNKGSIAQNIIAIRIDSKQDSLFWYYNITSPIFRNQIEKVQMSSAQPSLKVPHMKKFNVLVPPLPEQQKIAEILSTVDAKIEVIDQQITETQALKKGLMQRLLTKGTGHTEFKDSPLGEIPKSWEVVEIQKLIDQGRIISHLDGNHGGLYPSADEFINEGIPYIGANCFLNNRVDFSKCKHLSMERSLKFKKGVAKNGDVLFAHNATVGPVAFLETNLDFVILSTTATYYRLDNKTIDAKYWLFFLSSPIFKTQYEKVMGQSTRNQVPITMQRTFYSVLPSFKEQKEISEILNTADNKLEILLEKKTHYQELKQGLMQQLLTGKIRVKINNTVTA